MKTLQLFLITLLTAGFFASAQAAPPSCVEARFGVYFNRNIPNNVYFIDSSTANQGWQIISWQWYFGDGNGSGSQDPNYTYAQQGTYNVCLVVTASDNNGGVCSDSICKQINLPSPPPPNCQANFSYQLTQTFGAVQFTSNSTSGDSITSFSWSFGDGNSSDGKNPSHTYANAGVYYACLSIGTSHGCQSTFCDSVHITSTNPCSGVSAYWYYTSSSNGFTQFNAYDTATGPTHHDWSFGDGGNEGFGPAPTHTYAASGTYHVCQYVYVESGGGVPCSDSMCRNITVTDTNNCSGFAVSISDILTPQPPAQILQAHVTGGNNTNIIYKWSTGSGDASINISQSGNYCVTVTAGNCTASGCDSIHVTPPPTCKANFTYHLLTSFGNVQFTNASTAPDSIVSYSWYFGDNTSSTDKNPLHVFANGGVYYTCLRIQTTTGCVNYYCDSIHITNNGNPCTGFTADWTYVPGAHTPGSIYFSAVDTANGATHHDWNFGDGNWGFGSITEHNYAASGYYYVCQYVYVEANGGVACFDSVCKYIQVTVPNSCDGFSVSISDIIDPNDPARTLVAVVAGSSATGTKYKWSNGGTTSSIQVTASGNYCVTVTNANNCTASSCDSVTITGTNPCNGLTAAWTYTSSPNGSVHFVPTDTSSSARHIWSFGDNTSSSDISPTHFYANTGTYHVCLYIYVVGQTCVDSLCQTIQVNAGNPCSGIQANFTSTVSGQTIYLKSSGVYPTNAEYQWSLDGQKSSIGSYPYYYFQNVSYGEHRVCLYVYASANSIPCDSICNSVTVANPCNGITASWTSSVLQNGAIHFVPADTSRSVNHGWSFGDGTTSDNVDPVHTYSQSGTYRVCLYVYIAGTTCVDSSCQEIQVTVTNSCANFSVYIQDIPDTTGTGHTLVARAYSSNGSSTATTFAWSTNQTGEKIHVTQTGLYCVTATNQNCTAVACDTVHTSPGSCLAYFSYTAANTLNGFTFTDLSITSTPIIAWDWNFGDGDSSSSHNPSHNYANGGTYYVCLTITTASGCTATRCDSLRIKPCTGLRADWTPTYLTNGGVQFNGVNTSTTVYNLWIFGDGTTSTNFDPIHYYAQSGLYDVCHIVYIPGSLCADTSCHSIQAGGTSSCHAAFTYITPVSNGNTIYFTDASTSNDSIISWHWTFGDGSSSSNKNPSHTYTAQGNRFQVCLTIATAHGCTSTYCDSVTVGGSFSNCTTKFRWHAISCLTVEFTNASSSGVSFERWSFGDGTTDTAANPHHTYTQPGVYTVILDVYYGTTCYAADTQLVTLPTCAVNDTICGTVFGDASNSGTGGNNEGGIAGVQVNIGNISTITDSSGAYLVIVPPGMYFVSIITPSGCIPTMPLNNYGGTVVNGYYINGTTGGTYCGYNFGVNCNIVHICGTVFFDANNDGVQDSTEPGIPNIHLLIVDSSGAIHNAYTNQDGDYCETLPAGLYTITVATNYPPGAVTPSYIPVDATTGGTTYGNNNFAVYIPAGSCDLKVNLTPRSCVSPGFPAWYSIEVCNVGSNSTGGTVDMYYDPSLAFNYAYPAPTSQNSSTYTISWPVNNLAPGQCAYYWVAFKAPTVLTIGQPVLDVASVSTGPGCNDVNLDNNVDTVTQVVRGSWDPNNKQVNPAGEGSEGLIRGTEELTYSINFQNTGSAPAVNVVVQDAIPGYLDMATFRMVSSNPPFTSMQFNGNQVTWKFSNVLLPDSAADETNSHGYVSFAITPVTGLPQGTQIMNSGNVFFDYNSGMTTQSTLNTVDYALAVKNLSGNTTTITLQPNPFNDFTTVKMDGPAASYELKVYDMLGNLVNDQFTENNIFRVERGSMAAGVYIYQVVQQNKIIGMGKMVAQ